MPTNRFRPLHIGAGSAGRACGGPGPMARGSPSAKESRVGGTCVIRGCGAEKLLVYGAQFADALPDAVGFGWEPHLPSSTGEADRARTPRSTGSTSSTRSARRCGVTLMKAHGGSSTSNTVEVAASAIARGTSARHRAHRRCRPAGHQHVITSNEALDLAALPRRIVIRRRFISPSSSPASSPAGQRGDPDHRGEELLNGLTRCPRRPRPRDAARGITILARSRHRDRRRARRPRRSTRTARDRRDEVMSPPPGEHAQSRIGRGRHPLRRQGGDTVDEWSRSSVRSVYASATSRRLNLTRWRSPRGGRSPRRSSTTTR